MSYPEDVVLPALARELGRPVKWIEDRREHFLTTTQERDQIWDLIAVDDDGRSYLRTSRPRCGRLPLGHHYAIYLDHDDRSLLSLPLSSTPVVQNKPPTTPLRGAGRPRHGTNARPRRGIAIDKEFGGGTDPGMPYKMGLIFRDGAPVV